MYSGATCFKHRVKPARELQGTTNRLLCWRHRQTRPQASALNNNATRNPDPCFEQPSYQHHENLSISALEMVDKAKFTKKLGKCTSVASAYCEYAEHAVTPSGINTSNAPADPELRNHATDLTNEFRLLFVNPDIMLIHLRVTDHPMQCHINSITKWRS